MLSGTVVLFSNEREFVLGHLVDRLHGVRVPGDDQGITLALPIVAETIASLLPSGDHPRVEVEPVDAAHRDDAALAVLVHDVFPAREWRSARSNRKDRAGEGPERSPARSRSTAARAPTSCRNKAGVD